MDTIGDAEALPPEESARILGDPTAESEPEPKPRPPGLWNAAFTVEAQSIAAFALAMTALVGSNVLQLLAFSLFTTDNADPLDGTRLIAAGHGALAVAGIVLAVLALRRRAPVRGTWPYALSGAALIVAAVVLAIALAGWFVAEPAAVIALSRA